MTLPVIYDQRPRPKSVISCGESTPSFPEDFNRRLQSFDRDLWITWHKSPFSNKPGRWKIEMCVRHNGGFRANGAPEHSHVCNRTYVTMVEDEEGTPLPLGEHVLDKLREMRANSESYGGQTERGLRNFVRASDNLDQELEAKREMAREDIKRYNRKDKRVQVNRLMHLIEQHDLRPNK